VPRRLRAVGDPALSKDLRSRLKTEMTDDALAAIERTLAVRKMREKLLSP
jgi:hypothetical protein